MPKITPFLWFDTQAEEAMNHYLSIFKNSKKLAISRNAEKVLTCQFEIEGQQLIALNGGPHFKLTEAFSLVVNCETQAEVDALWDKLSAGGQTSRCGWLKDKYGLSWQIVPAALGRMLSDQDPKRSGRVMEAMLRMDKLDIAALERAYESQG